MLPPSEFEKLLAIARSGSRASIGQLLETYRNYLLVLANAGLNPILAAKAGGSDLVQKTFIDAYQSMDRFRGSSEVELLAWLRRILQHNLTDLDREFRGTAARDVRRELHASDSRPIEHVADDAQSPSSEIASVEESRRLEHFLSRLPEGYREVIMLRNRDRLRFAEIGERLGRSPDAARMLWNRAIELLQAEMERR